MMSKPRRVDLLGQKFSRLTPIEYKGNDKGGNSRWLCKCDCGNIKVVGRQELVNGTTKSCGCFRKEVLLAKKGVPNPHRSGGPQTLESNLKRSLALKGRPAHNKGKPSILKGRHSPLKGRPGRNWNEDQKLAKSTSMKELILSGVFTPQNNSKKKPVKVSTSKGGVVLCHSSWEVVYSLYLEGDKNVLSFKKDKIRIPYSKEGKESIYIVDFLVEYTSGQTLLVEIKPKSLLLEQENILKFEAARLWCKENCFEFMIISEPEIIKINNGCLPKRNR